MSPSNISITTAIGRENVPVPVMKFPGGELQVDIPEVVRHDLKFCGSVTIRAKLTCADDVMALLLTTDALRRIDPTLRIALVCPYFPYARQDRVCAPGQALSVRVMADLINAQNYAQVTVWDPHSDVTGALINNLKVVPQDEIAAGCVGERDVLVAPDAGALKKAEKLAARTGRPLVRADKERDPVTGAITGTKVYSEHIGDADFLIVDDICDGGRTFIELAKALKPLTNGRVLLYVTHGIFSRGAKPLEDAGIGHVFCANPFPKWAPHHPLITIL